MPIPPLARVFSTYTEILSFYALLYTLIAIEKDEDKMASMKPMTLAVALKVGQKVANRDHTNVTVFRFYCTDDYSLVHAYRFSPKLGAFVKTILHQSIYKCTERTCKVFFVFLNPPWTDIPGLIYAGWRPVVKYLTLPCYLTYDANLAKAAAEKYGVRIVEVEETDLY